MKRRAAGGEIATLTTTDISLAIPAEEDQAANRQTVASCQARTHTNYWAAEASLGRSCCYPMVSRAFSIWAIDYAYRARLLLSHVPALFHSALSFEGLTTRWANAPNAVGARWASSKTPPKAWPRLRRLRREAAKPRRRGASGFRD